jgi:hypothetical protein
MSSQNTAAAKPKGQFSYQHIVLWSGKDCPLQNDISYALLAFKIFYRQHRHVIYTCLPYGAHDLYGNQTRPFTSKKLYFYEPSPHKGIRNSEKNAHVYTSIKTFQGQHVKFSLPCGSIRY